MSLISPISAVVVIVATLIAAAMDLWKFKVYNAADGTAATKWPDLPPPRRAGSAWPIARWVSCSGSRSCSSSTRWGGWGPATSSSWRASAPGLASCRRSISSSPAPLAGGVYAVASLVLAGGLHETAIHLQILILRMTAFGRILGSDARVESELQRDDRRRRLIPFAAMLAVGVIAQHSPGCTSSPMRSRRLVRRAEASRSNSILKREPVGSRILPAYTNLPSVRRWLVRLQSLVGRRSRPGLRRIGGRGGQIVREESGRGRLEGRNRPGRGGRRRHRSGGDDHVRVGQDP